MAYTTQSTEASSSSVERALVTVEPVSVAGVDSCGSCGGLKGMGDDGKRGGSEGGGGEGAGRTCGTTIVSTEGVLVTVMFDTPAALKKLVAEAASTRG